MYKNDTMVEIILLTGIARDNNPGTILSSEIILIMFYVTKGHGLGELK